MKKHYTTIDDYIAASPENTRAMLEKIRQIIRENAPNAEETISYGMPSFKLNGNLVYFAAFKNHIGFYPVPSGIEAFRDELAPFIAGKGTLQFPLDKPIPYDIIKKVVVFRVKENLAKAKKRK